MTKYKPNAVSEQSESKGPALSEQSESKGWDTSYEWKAVTLLGLGFGLVGLDRWIIAPLFPFMNNVRYITSTNIGTWAQDKISRFTLLPQKDEPILWDFGSAARHHQLYCPCS